MAVVVTATTPGGSSSATFTTTAAGPLPIPASLTNTTWTAPAGTYTAPAARTACHGAVTVNLTACQLVDGGGTVGLLNAAVDCTAVTINGPGAPAGTGRGPSAPAAYLYATTSSTTGPLVNVVDNATCLVTLNGVTTSGLMKLVAAQGTNAGSKAVLRGVFSTGLAVAVEILGSIDLDNTVLRGGGPNTNPVGLHSFQYQGASPPGTRLAWIPGVSLRCTNSEVTGFVSSATTGFLQGDAILAESSCEYLFIDNCLLGNNSDSGGVDSKACWGQISNSTIESLGGRAISQHCMGDGRGTWNGLRSISNVIHVPNATIPVSGGLTEAYQAEGVLETFNDVITLASGARLAVTAFGDAPGSGAPATYPRLGSITTHNVRDANGVLVTGPTVKGDDANHHTTISILPS